MVGAPALPGVFVLDRDRTSLEELVTDLSRRFGNDFAVSGASNNGAALQMLQSMAAANERVALLLVDARELEFLERAHELHPDAKRVLLVNRDYTTTSPVPQAITLGRADYHIVRPWSDDESMFLSMSEYLSAWEGEQEPNFELFRIVAEEGDTRLAQLRDVMTRFSMPFSLYPISTEAGRRLLEDAGLDESQLPAVIRYDGDVMVNPGLAELAGAIGVNVVNDVERCEIAIVGAGPAGLTAAVYAASEGLDTVMLERAISGGQAGTSPMIRNYPGFPHGVNGGQLMQRTCEQAWMMGAHIVFAQQAVTLEIVGDDRIVHLLDGTSLTARAVVIATGIEWRRLGVPSLESLVGAGVFYGAAVGESRSMRDQDVFIVGAGNSAGQAALHLAEHARSVTLLVRGDNCSKSMSDYLVRAIESTANVVVRLRTEVVDGAGEGRLERLTLADRATGTTEDVPATALFIMIGGEPHTQWLPDTIARDRQGYVLTGRDLATGSPQTREPLTLETSVPGVFAAGDVRYGSIKRVASAVGEGATVVRIVHEYLAERPGGNRGEGRPARLAAPT